MGLGPVIRVLFLCTGNSARSILAEGLLNHHGGGAFEAYSAGSQPLGRVNPLALEALANKGIQTGAARSKNWDEFARPNTPVMDVVITVCDNAAGEVCPVWPGHPLTLHWGLADPAAVDGSLEEKRLAFLKTCLKLELKIFDLLALAAKNPDKETFLAELKQMD